MEDNNNVCERCGRPLVQTFIDVSEDTPYFLCAACAKARSTCQGCVNSDQCFFMEDTTVQLPQMVFETRQEGPMTVQMQVPNPERIKLTCEQKCICWDKEDQWCGRLDDYCSRYVYRPW